MTALKLKSSNSQCSIEFSEVKGECFRVSITADDHSGTHEVYATTDAKGVVRLFQEAARDWKGWEKPKVWETFDHELRLELTTDGKGHVAFDVLIALNEGHADRWQLRSRIGLEAGQLESIARDAERLWNK